MATSTGSLTDRQLLELFVRQHDEESFTQLVQRHGPMVLGVCRQILRREQDAEDAFQATFLVLSSKAGSIRSREALPNWLFNVANRLSKRMRAAAARRQSHEVELVEPPLSEPEPEEGTCSLGPILNEEIGRLPDKYRIPFVLCYVEGKTNEEAARQLGCPTGTVFSRLARARDGLRARLKYRGVVISSGALAAALTSLTEQASAAVPPPLVNTTVRAAMRFRTDTTGGTSRVSARVVEMVQWAVKVHGRRLRAGPAATTLRGSRTLQLGVALLVTVGLLGAVGWLLLRHRPAKELILPPGLAERPIAERLQGSWTATSLNMGGNQIPGPQAELIFKDNQMTLSDTSGTFRIDAAKDPMQLDWTVQGVAIPYIFKLRGDEFTLCVMQGPDRPANDALPRPSDFSPQPGKIIMTFKRQQH
jgi:RNA polymerase sigma factor (sigma-70 family)